MTRVAYVCADPGVPVFGTKGASVHVQEVLRQLVRRGAEVVLVCARTDGPPPADLTGVRVVPLPRSRSRELARRELDLLAADAGLGPLLARHGPFDLVYERYSLWSRGAMAYARSTGTPGVLEVNAPLPEEQAAHRGLVHRAAALEVLGSVLGQADAVVCVSEPVAAWARRHAPTRARLHVVPNGVDLDRVTPGPEPAGPFTVGFVGTLKPWHGVDVLVRAASLVTDVRLLLVGDGPQREAIEELAGRLGTSDRVEVTGAVPPVAVPEHLHRMHAAAAPYPTADGYFSPLKVFEYLAAGLPVVASRAGQLPALLTDRADALLVPPGDVAALAGAVRLLRDDPALRARLGQAARTTAGGHSWAAAVSRILATVGVGLPARAGRAAVA
jgi:glycosyltransferase involved in cell wall biosynthesis